jgi:hypothetical protein
LAEEEVRVVLDAIGALERIEDPERRARALTEMLEVWPKQHGRLREMRQQAVLTLYAQGKTYREIGLLLGIHFTRVSQIARGQRGVKNRPSKKQPSEESRTQLRPALCWCGALCRAGPVSSRGGRRSGTSRSSRRRVRRGW